MTQWIHRILMVVIFILTALMFLSVFGQVVFRYVLKHPLQGSEELARYLMVWVCCLAASEAYRSRFHVAVSFLIDIFSDTMKKRVDQCIQILVIVLMGVIACHGFRLSWLLYDQISPALGIPMTWPYLAVPVGAVLIGFHAIVFLVRKTDCRSL